MHISTLPKPALVLEVDPDSGTILRVDEVLEAALGFEPGAAAGQNISVVSQSRLRLSESPDESVAQMFSDATHDLVAPLNQVSTLTALLVRKNQELLSGPDAREVLDHIQAAVRRMQSLAEGLKRFSRTLGEPMSLERVDAGQVLAAAIRNCDSVVKAGDVEISFGALPEIMADRRRMAIVFQELIENAIKFHKSGPVRIEVTAETRDAQWVFSVRDNGAGIDARLARDVFRIFRRLDAGSAPGSGVGLTICRQIIEQHHGAIWAESEPGKGTAIVFSLPRTGWEATQKRSATQRP